jgi:hypothetical protein
MAQVSEIVEMVVETLEFGQDSSQMKGAFWDLTLACGFNGLAKGECMGDAVHTRNSFCDQHGKPGIETFEPFLHAPMFEEQPRMAMQDCFANVVEDNLS